MNFQQVGNNLYDSIDEDMLDYGKRQDILTAAGKLGEQGFTLTGKAVSKGIETSGNITGNIVGLVNKDIGQNIKKLANNNSTKVKEKTKITSDNVNKISSQTGSKVSQTADKIGNKIESTVDKNIKDPIITTIGNTSNLIQSEVDKLNNGTIDTNTRVVSQQEYNNLKPLEEKYPSTGLLGHILDFNANGTNYNGCNIEIIGKAQDGNLIVQESLKTGALLGGTPETIAKIGTQDS